MSGTTSIYVDIPQSDITISAATRQRVQIMGYRAKGTDMSRRIRKYWKCHHFNGLLNECCSVGVSYESVRSDSHRLPCIEPHPSDERPAGQCETFRLSTPEEIAEEEAAIQECIKRFTTTMPLIAEIKEQHRNTDWAGVVECPVCKGRLHMTHAACNGHVHGKCETADCLAWME